MDLVKETYGSSTEILEKIEEKDPVHLLAGKSLYNAPL